jgi:hypothetical protein
MKIPNQCKLKNFNFKSCLFCLKSLVYGVPMERDSINSLEAFSVDGLFKSKEHKILLELEGFDFLVPFQRFDLLSVAALTKIDFPQMDANFKYFAKQYLDHLKKGEYSNWEISLIHDSLFDLMLKNVGFCNSELFPNADIQQNSSKLQLKMLMNGFYFKLLPQVSKPLNDIQFHFE